MIPNPPNAPTPNPAPRTPAQPRATPPTSSLPSADLRRMLEACFEGALATGDPWLLRVEQAEGAGKRAERHLPGIEAVLNHVATLAPEAKARRSLRVGLLLRAEQPDAPVSRLPYRLRMVGFAVELDPVLLYARCGLWADPDTWNELGDPDSRLLSQDQRSRAKVFFSEQLQRSAMQPTVVLQTWGSVVAFWRLKAPLVGSEAARALVDQVAGQVAAHLHGVRAAGCSVDLPAPLDYLRDGNVCRAARILECQPERGYDLELLRARTRDAWEASTRGHSAAGRARIQGDPMWQARTLPEGWTLTDLGLPPRLLDDERLDVERLEGPFQASWRTRLAAWMAARRYGFHDVLEVLGTVRPSPAGEIRGDELWRPAVIAHFQIGLRAAGPRDPVRLPYGIKTIVPVGDVLTGGVGGSFEVSGGSAGKPFALVVSYETLRSSRAFRSALGKHLGFTPYLVPRGIWEALLTRGLADERLRQRPDGLKPLGQPNLSTLVKTYAAQALQPTVEVAGGGAGGGTTWPRQHDDLVVFPLRHLRDWLASRCQGRPHARGEVTAVIRALDGGDYGTLRLPGNGFVRCWWLPSRTGGQP